MKSVLKMSTRELGTWGENYACKIIVEQGFEITQRNWRYSRYGEIDIIARHGKMIVFIEVKTRRTNRTGTPIESITYHKYQQIRKLARMYLKIIEVYEPEIRIDIIGITVNNRQIKAKHIQGVQMW